MRIAITLLLVGCMLHGVAQTSINKTYPVRSGQVISMRFDYPELIKISSWDKNEIQISGSVSINGGENDDAFELLQSTMGNVISIENKIRNMKELPHLITIVDKGEKITFKTKADFKKYCEEKGRSFNIRSEGVDMDIFLDIKVPRNAEVKLESVYGMVEVKNYAGPLVVEATYGGVDVTVPQIFNGELTAETNYGQIFSNLDIKFSGSSFEDFHTQVTAKQGSIPKHSFESKYGNVYLRKDH